MQKTWIVLADAGRGRIVSQAGRTAPLVPVREIDNPLGRAHTSELVTDHPGGKDNRGHGGMSGMTPPTDPHEQQAVEFAHSLAKLLNHAADQREYDELILVAPPHFLGLLREAIAPAAKERLAASHPMDLTRLPLDQVKARLADLFRAPLKSS